MLFSSITRRRLRVHASVSVLLSRALLRMPPYTEVDECSFFGRHARRILSFSGSVSIKSSATLAKMFILTAVLFTGIHAQVSQPVKLPPAPELPQYIAMSGIGSSSATSMVVEKPLTILEKMKQARSERAEARKELAMNREPVHAAAPERIAPMTLKQKGVYLTASSVARSTFLDETVEKVKTSNGNAVIFDVKGGGVLYHSGAPMANELGLVRSIYDLPAVIEKLHAEGLEVIGRFVAIKDEAFTAKRPDTRVKHPITGQVLNYTWVDPANDDAIRFNMESMCELAASGIDEINLDYIRFSTAEVGALSVLSGKEKADRVEKFILAARETINRCGPKTRLGLSTYAILGWSYDINVETLGQDVVRFAPLVDVISPMAYPATFAEGHYYNPAVHPRSRMYYLVHRTVTGYRELLGPDHSWKIRPWIQGYGVTTKNMQDQMDAVYDSGSCGYLVWNAGNNYAPTYAAMSKSDVPVQCQ